MRRGTERERRNRSWDYEIKLISVTKTLNENGFEEETSEEISVFANRLPVHSSEFYQSSKEGYIIAQVFEIHSIEYDGQTSLKYEGDVYNIKRPYDTGEYIELSCERRDDTYE